MIDAILQGTTPEICFDFSEYDFSVTDITQLQLAIENGSTCVIYGLNDVIVDGEANSITKRFTHEETLALDYNGLLKHQMLFWLSDGSVLGTEQNAVCVVEWIGKGASA